MCVVFRRQVFASVSHQGSGLLVDLSLTALAQNESYSASRPEPADAREGCCAARPTTPGSTALRFASAARYCEGLVNAAYRCTKAHAPRDSNLTSELP